MKKIINTSSRFEPASSRVDVHDATTELLDSVTIGSNTTALNKTQFNVPLARPALINSSINHTHAHFFSEASYSRASDYSESPFEET